MKRVLSFFLQGAPYSLKKSSLLIFGSSALTVLIFFTSLFVWKGIASRDENSFITGMIQTSSRYQALPNEFFAEALHLSIDKPKRKKDLCLKACESALTDTHLFQSLQLSFYNPSTVLINYEMCTPIGQSADFSNTLVTEEGYLIPHFPFFSFKNLPKIKLGLSDKINVWNFQVDSQRLQLFKTFIHSFKNLELLDLSNCFSPSLGRREIVAQLKEEKKIIFLRMPSQELEESFHHYSLLKEQISPLVGRCVVDLRSKETAYICRADSMPP